MDENFINHVLPDHIVLYIISFLNRKQDKDAVSLVCKQWFAMEGSLRRVLVLNLEDLFYPRIDSPINCISFLLSRFDNLVELKIQAALCFFSTLSSNEISKPYLSSSFKSIKFNTDFSDEVIHLVIKNCTKLRILSLSHLSLSSNALKMLSTGLKGLKILEIRYPGASNLPLLLKFPFLTELSISHCSDASMDHAIDGSLFSPSFSTLNVTKLTLEGISSPSSAIKWIWRKCHGLRFLCLQNCETLSCNDSIFKSIINNLEELHLIRCRGISSQVLFIVASVCSSLLALKYHDGGETEGMHAVIQNSPKLQRLDLRLPLDLNDIDVLRMSNARNSLSSLRLQCCWGLTATGIYKLVPCISKSLQDLAIVCCKPILQDMSMVASLFQQLTGLRHLDLSCNITLTDSDMAIYLDCCRSIECLNLNDCRGLTNTTLQWIMVKCVHMHSLIITGCDKLKPDAILELMRHSRRMKSIRLNQNCLLDEILLIASLKNIQICH